MQRPPRMKFRSPFASPGRTICAEKCQRQEYRQGAPSAAMGLHAACVDHGEQRSARCCLAVGAMHAKTATVSERGALPLT